MSQLFFFLIERKTTATAKGDLILRERFQALSEPGMDERLGRNLSSDGQSLLKDRWGLIATGGGGGGLWWERIKMFLGSGMGWEQRWLHPKWDTRTLLAHKKASGPGSS